MTTNTTATATVTTKATKAKDSRTAEQKAVHKVLMDRVTKRHNGYKVAGLQAKDFRDCNYTKWTEYKTALDDLQNVLAEPTAYATLGTKYGEKFQSPAECRDYLSTRAMVLTGWKAEDISETIKKLGNYADLIAKVVADSYTDSAKAKAKEFTAERQKIESDTKLSETAKADKLSNLQEVRETFMAGKVLKSELFNTANHAKFRRNFEMVTVYLFKGWALYAGYTSLASKEYTNKFDRKVKVARNKGVSETIIAKAMKAKDISILEKAIEDRDTKAVNKVLPSNTKPTGKPKRKDSKATAAK